MKLKNFLELNLYQHADCYSIVVKQRLTENELLATNIANIATTTTTTTTSTTTTTPTTTIATNAKPVIEVMMMMMIIKCYYFDQNLMTILLNC